MSGQHQNVNMEIADEKLSDVVGGAQGEEGIVGTDRCPYCSANLPVEKTITCPQCGKITLALNSNKETPENKFS